MAKVRTCLGIDIGMHSIRIAEVAAGPQGVEIKNLCEARLQLEPGQKEAQRQGAIVSQLNQLIKANKIKSKLAVFCVPGQSVFVRRVRVPATTPDRLQRIIRFEAREQIPFPLEKTILEYQVFPTDTPSEVEVLMVAIKREYIDNFMKLVNKTGLKQHSISVSSLALHNYHEANSEARKLIEDESKKKEKKPSAKKKSAKKAFSLKFGKKKGEPEPVEESEEEAPEDAEAYDAMQEEIQAEINLGSSAMDITLPKVGPQRMVGFTRSVPVAGSQIDRAIRTKLGIESLEEAIRVKEQESVVLASDFEIEGDTSSVNMPASEAATAVVDRMIAEIRKTLEYFLSQPDGVAVDGIVLSGGLTKMRYFSNYLEEKMGLPVELASMKNEGFKVSEELAERVPSFVVPIGLALQGVGVGQIKIDFMPQDVKNLRAIKDRRGQIAVASVLLALTVLGGIQAGGNYIAINSQLADTYEQEISKSQRASQNIKSVEAANAAIATKYQQIWNSKGHRFAYMELMLCFLTNRPPDVLFEQLSVGNDGSVTVRGRTPRRQAITEFLDNLSQDTLFVRQANFSALAADAITDPRFPTQVYPFELTITSFSRVGRYRGMKSSSAATVDKSGKVQVGGAKDSVADKLKGMSFGLK